MLAAVALAARVGAGGQRLDGAARAAPRGLGGHRRVRVPDRARPRPARPADLAAAHPDRAGARSRSRSSCARSCPCCGPSTRDYARRRPRSGRVPGSGLARGGRADRGPCRARSRPASRSRSRSASSAPRVFLARPDTQTLPIVIFRLLGQPGRAELRRRDGGEHDPDGAHRSRGAADRPGARRPGCSDALRRGPHGPVRRHRRASTASASTWATREVVGVLGPSGSGKSHAAARHRRASKRPPRAVSCATAPTCAEWRPTGGSSA